MSQLTQRVFNGPLVQFANFTNNTHVNLIRLKKPYSNGISYAVQHVTKSQFNDSGLFKTIEQATKRFESVVNKSLQETTLRNRNN